MAATQQPPMSAFMEHATPAQTVSNQFVSQFYTVLHTSPRNLHRFYSEASTLTLADTRPDGQYIVKTVTGQKSIHEMVMNQGLEDTVTEVYSVDSQYSLNGGVVVQVTGTQSNKSGPKRPFVQTFFLAVQEKGFYVMNDMFRYLPDFRLLFGVENGYPAAAMMQQVPKTNGMAAVPPPVVAAPPVPAAPAMMPPAPLPVPVPVALAVQPVPGQIPPAVVPQAIPPPPMPLPIPPPPAAVVAPPPPAAAAPAVRPPPTAAAAAPPQQPAQQQPPAPAQQQPQQEQQPPSPPAPRPITTEVPKAEPGVPLSYAERLKQGKVSLPSSPTKQPAAATTAPAPAPVPAPRAPEQAAAPSAAAAAAAPAAGSMERSASQSGSEAGGFPVEGPQGSSVFVREIPASVTIEGLVAKLSQFGPLRPNGVNLKTQRGKDSYAFVDFETVEAAQACMEQGLDFDGHHVNVVEKRPMLFRGGMRGRGGPPTGYSGRGERGGYRGGRGGRGPPYPGGPMMMDGGRGMGGRMGPMGGMPPMRGRGDGRMRFDDRGRGRGPRPPMPVPQ